MVKIIGNWNKAEIISNMNEIHELKTKKIKLISVYIYR